MMAAIRQYLLTLIGAAVVCAIITNLINKSTMSGALIKLLCGIFLTICVVSPVIDLDFSSIQQYFTAFSDQSEETVATGAEMSESTLRQSIKQQTESYILDKAASMNTELSVEVTLSDDELPVPAGVVLTGNISPYAKIRMTEFLTSDLGISKENQVWIR